MKNACTFSNGQSLPLSSVPPAPWQDFCDRMLAECAAGARIVSFFGVPEQDMPKAVRISDAKGTQLRIFAVLARAAENVLAVAASVVNESYPSLTPLLPAMHLFERALHEQYAVTPLGHPWLKPVRFPHDNGPRAGDMPFFQVGGEGVHEVAVGPVHAGVIEPGHFRFQCLGETVLHLEISLGYQHRGIEDALKGGPHKNTFPVMETIAGDTSIGHAWAACGIAEGLSGIPASPRGLVLRAIALELERLANHTGDLGALSGDVGFLPSASYCGRIRGDFLNMTASLCGNRFGRNCIRPGGVIVDVNEDTANDIDRRVHAACRDVRGAMRLFFDAPSVTARMMGTGVLSKQAALDMGMVGPAARASDVPVDTRKTHPLPGMEEFIPHLCTEKSGDILARSTVRMREIRESATLVGRLLKLLPRGETYAPQEGKLAPLSFAASLVEGWRGEICHAALTDDTGHYARYSVTDPSFHNWMGLALAMREQTISDFPLCNKSFNLSYCGCDL
ncbi:hydrogenase [Deltaproteobacteria bacterium]|nr:hydrogenase [Deltaproteobacteria bacterium]